MCAPKGLFPSAQREITKCAEAYDTAQQQAGMFRAIMQLLRMSGHLLPDHQRGVPRATPTRGPGVLPRLPMTLFLSGIPARFARLCQHPCCVSIIIISPSLRHMQRPTAFFLARSPLGRSASGLPSFHAASGPSV